MMVLPICPFRTEGQCSPMCMLFLTAKPVEVVHESDICAHGNEVSGGCSLAILASATASKKHSWENYLAPFMCFTFPQYDNAEENEDE